MLVNRKKASVTTIAGITFFPGNNTIEGANVDELRNHADFKAQVAAGYMAEVESKPKETPNGKSENTDSKDGAELTDNITEMSAKDAIFVIKETLHVNQLDAMLILEEENKDRKGVKKAIEDQLEVLRKEDGADGQEDE